jgi:hypothetical protein
VLQSSISLLLYVCRKLFLHIGETIWIKYLKWSQASLKILYMTMKFEIRVTDEGDKLEIWKVGYEDGNCIGYVDLVAEFNLEQMPREVA